MTDPVARLFLGFRDTAESSYKAVDFTVGSPAPASPSYFAPIGVADSLGGVWFDQPTFLYRGTLAGSGTDPTVVAMPDGLASSWAAAQAADYQSVLVANQVSGVGALVGLMAYQPLDNHLLVLGLSKAVVLEYDPGTGAFTGNRRVFDYGAAAATSPVANVFAVSWHLDAGQLCPRFWFHNRYAFDPTIVYWRQVRASELPAVGGSVTLGFRAADSGYTGKIAATALDSFTDQYQDPITFEDNIQYGAIMAMVGALGTELASSASYANAFAYNSTDDSVRGNGGGYLQGPATLDGTRYVCTFYDRIFQTVAGSTVTANGDGYNYTASNGRLDAPTQLQDVYALEPIYCPSGGFVYASCLYPSVAPPTPVEPTAFWTALRKAVETI